MHKNIRTLVLTCLALVFTANACQLPVQPSPVPEQTRLPAAATTQPQEQEDPGAPPPPGETPAGPDTPTVPQPPRATGPAMPPLAVDPAAFAKKAALTRWQPGLPYAGADYRLPLDLSQAANPQVLEGLTTEQLEMLARNGFVVIHSQEAQFSDIRETVSKKHGQPYYLTTDAAYHALHGSFSETLKALEEQHLQRTMADLVGAALEETLRFREQVRGTSLEAEVEQAAAYLGVALRLFDPQARIDPAVEPRVAAQVQQIMAEGGRERSVLFPAFEDDYAAYKPVSHYASSPRLERYFRGMTWLGRVHFSLDDSTQPPSKVPLIITLALRRAPMYDRTAADHWRDVHEMLAFLIGPTDDGGPAEYSVLMDEVYGPGLTIADLDNPALWQEFLQRRDEIPAPRINSTFVDSLDDLEQEGGWRFMGQRFTLDGFIFQNLVYDKVGSETNPRELPSGFDLPAAFGSDLALKILEQKGAASYENYSTQMDAMRAAVAAQPEAEWLGTFYSAWLYAFFPQLAVKTSDAYPAYMRTPAWAYKDLNSLLGSWAQLKHDTALYAKMPEMAGGGGPPASGPAPAHIEPNPGVFYRLAYVARTLHEGLAPIAESPILADPEPGGLFPYGLASIVWQLQHFAENLERMGDIAVKELAGLPLTPDDLEVLQSCLGPLECQVLYTHTIYSEGQELEMPPVPVIAAVAGGKTDLLEVAVGYVDRIYVAVAVEGRMHIAQGGVFAYYEFHQPREYRVTDETWRQRLSANPAPRDEWALQFGLPGGEPVNFLAFRAGDWYKITEEGADLNVRANPTTNAAVLQQLEAGDYVEILEGPVQAAGYTWWKIRIGFGQVEGWVVEHQEWYERAWGQ